MVSSSDVYYLVILLLSINGILSANTDVNNCRKCKPGFFAKQQCNIEHDTICAPCPSRHFMSLDDNVATACNLCSPCPSGSYITVPCSPTNNTQCKSCDHVIDSESFKTSCNGEKVPLSDLNIASDSVILDKADETGSGVEDDVNSFLNPNVTVINDMISSDNETDGSGEVILEIPTPDDIIPEDKTTISVPPVSQDVVDEELIPISTPVITKKTTKEITTKSSVASTSTTALPTKKTTALPSEKTTALPTEKSKALQSEKSTALPLEKTTALPTEKSTALPSEKSTALPSEKSTALPSEKTTALPTKTTATTILTEKTTATTEKTLDLGVGIDLQDDKSDEVSVDEDIRVTVVPLPTKVKSTTLKEENNETPVRAFAPVSERKTEAMTDDSDKVSIGIVIAVAIIAAIVFFIVGFIASKYCRRRRQEIKMMNKIQKNGHHNGSIPVMLDMNTSYRHNGIYDEIGKEANGKCSISKLDEIVPEHQDNVYAVPEKKKKSQPEIKYIDETTDDEIDNKEDEALLETPAPESTENMETQPNQQEDEAHDNDDSNETSPMLNEIQSEIEQNGDIASENDTLVEKL